MWWSSRCRRGRGRRRDGARLIAGGVGGGRGGMGGGAGARRSGLRRRLERWWVLVCVRWEVWSGRRTCADGEEEEADAVEEVAHGCA